MAVIESMRIIIIIISILVSLCSLCFAQPGSLNMHFRLDVIDIDGERGLSSYIKCKDTLKTWPEAHPPPFEYYFEVYGYQSLPTTHSCPLVNIVFIDSVYSDTMELLFLYHSSARIRLSIPFVEGSYTFSSLHDSYVLFDYREDSVRCMKSLLHSKLTMEDSLLIFKNASFLKELVESKEPGNIKYRKFEPEHGTITYFQTRKAESKRREVESEIRKVESEKMNKIANEKKKKNKKIARENHRYSRGRRKEQRSKKKEIEKEKEENLKTLALEIQNMTDSLESAGWDRVSKRYKFIGTDSLIEIKRGGFYLRVFTYQSKDNATRIVRIHKKYRTNWNKDRNATRRHFKYTVLYYNNNGKKIKKERKKHNYSPL
jgi:hypothetical protein